MGFKIGWLTWEQRKFSELYSKNVERNSTNEFNFDKTISIAKMRYNSEGNGASKNSLQNYKVIRIGDVAFEGHTNKEFQYGRFVVNSLGNGIMSPRFAVLRPIRPTVVNFWKYYLHNERSMNRILVRATKAGTMMNELVYSDLAKEKIKVPIEKEQIEIGNLFSILDRTITLHEEKRRQLERLKKALLQEIFADETGYPALRFKGFTEKWEQRKLGELVTYQNGVGHESNQLDEGKYELVNLNSIAIDGGLKNSGKFINKTAETLLKNDLVMVLSDVGHGDLLGRVAIIPENYRYVLNQRVALLRGNSQTNVRFLFSYINAHQMYFKREGAGSSQLNISRGSVERFKVYLPSISEQKQIGKTLFLIDRTITLHDKKIQYLKQLKRGLLQKMFV